MALGKVRARVFSAQLSAVKNFLFDNGDNSLIRSLFSSLARSFLPFSLAGFWVCWLVGWLAGWLAFEPTQAQRVSGWAKPVAGWSAFNSLLASSPSLLRSRLLEQAAFLRRLTPVELSKSSFFLHPKRFV